MVETKNARPEDKTILKSAGEIEGSEASEELTPVKQFIPYLVIIDGPKAGTRFQLRDGDNLIGRSVSSVALLEDASVSRRHAVLTHTQTGWVFSDSGSKNGSYVNGQRVRERVNLGHGDIIQVGIYAMRLVTRPVSSDEEMAPLPSDIDGKTVMVSASAADEKGGQEEGAETRTMAEAGDEGKTGEVFVREGGPSEEGEGELKEEDALLEDGEGGIPPEPEVEPERKRSPFIQYGAMAAAILVVAVLGGYLYWSFIRTPAPPEAVPPATAPQVIGQTSPVPMEAPKRIPVFLDFASSPLPARVSMDGRDYGMAPLKVNVEMEIGKVYTAQGTFNLEELQDTKTVNVTFTVTPDSGNIPILFKGPIGILRITNIPRDTQLYLEGYYADDPFKPRVAKLADVVFGKPVYLPYGRYIVELRFPKQVGESNQFVEDIRFKREFTVSEDSPIFEVAVTDDDLHKFPVDIKSIPDRADVFIDGILVGQTPYKGIFPLGEHTMTLRKEGYFEHTQNLKMDINMPYKVEIPLKTTVAGQYINAGNALFNKGMYKDAIAQLSEVFKNQPTPREVSQTQYLLGSCYLKMGDMATALGYYEQARQNPDFQLNAMLGMANIYGLSKDMGRALPLLVEVMLKAQDEQLKRDATAVFRQLSPLRSIMYIYTEPAGATVIVNDKPIEQRTPLILHDLGLGNYKIRIQKDGYQPQDLSINMSVAEFNPVIIKLKPVEE